jgi:hypothetical protein
MTKSTKDDVVSRPTAKPLGQRVPAGVARLLGEEPSAPAAAAQAPAEPAKSRKSRREAANGEARVTFALRYRASYMDRLETLYLQQRASRRKVAKADLVEEALDLLFAKYARKA